MASYSVKRYYNEACAKASENVDEVQFHFTVDNLNAEFNSQIVYVGGQPWYCHIEQIIMGIRLTLHTMNIKRTDNWAVITSTSIKLISSINKDLSLQSHMEAVFTSKSLANEYPFCIAFDELKNPLFGYVNDDKLKFEVKIHAGRLQDLTTTDGIKLETMRKCCDASTYGKFRLTIDHSIDFFGICSPSFVLANIPWRISVVKSEDQTGQKKNIILQILLQNLDETIYFSFLQMSTTCKLVSPDPNIQSISCTENGLTATGSHFPACSNLFRLDSENFLLNFIQNDKFIVEVNLNIKKTNGVEATTGRQCCLDNFGLECAICFTSLLNCPVSTPKCGHMFCKQCIETTIRNNGVCPTCNQAAKIADLRTLFLPMV